MEESAIEKPVLLIENECLCIFSHMPTRGPMILNKAEASLLLIELYKFLNINQDEKIGSDS